MKWDLKELNNLCINKNLPDSKVYQESLLWKKELVLFHSKNSNEAWNKLFRRHLHKKLIVGNKNWQDAHLASEAHVICAAQALHSMGDILGQIINQVILPGALSEDEVSLRNVLSRLNEEVIAPNIVTKIQQLKDSPEFKYIDAFVNITKHRRILKTEYRAEGGPGTRNDQGIIFKQFNYKNENYPITWAKDIVGPYKNKIFIYICDVGNSINSYLR